MSISSVSPFYPSRPKCDIEHAKSFFGITALYALVGTTSFIASPLSAAVYCTTSTLCTRIVHWALEKSSFVEKDNLTHRITAFASSFFIGSVVGALLTSAIGLPISFTAGIFLHGAVIATVLTVTAVAFVCLICSGVWIGVSMLPNSN
jgi:hypothetical protein